MENIVGVKIGQEVIYISKDDQQNFKFVDPNTKMVFGPTYKYSELKSDKRNFLLKYQTATSSNNLLRIKAEPKITSSGRKSTAPANPNASSNMREYTKNLMSGFGVKFSSGAQKKLFNIGDSFSRTEGSDQFDSLENERLELTTPLVLGDDQVFVFGNNEAKESLSDNLEKTIQFPLIFKTEGGILLYGPPGNGKTAVVRWAVSKMKNTVFFAPNPGQLLSSYQAESEKNLNALFEAASDVIGKPPPKKKKDKISSFNDRIEEEQKKEKEETKRRKTEFENELLRQNKKTVDLLDEIRDYEPRYNPKNRTWATLLSKLFKIKEKEREEKEKSENNNENPQDKNLVPRSDIVKNAVIFFDEIDGISGSRDNQSGAQGSEKSVLSTLLNLMDGVKKRPGLIVIGATNKPWLLDEALLRRLGKRIYIDLPDKEAIQGIIRKNFEQYFFPERNFDYLSGNDLRVYPRDFDPIIKKPDENRNLLESDVSDTPPKIDFIKPTKFIKLIEVEKKEEEKTNQDSGPSTTFKKRGQSSSTTGTSSSKKEESNYYATESTLKNFNSTFQNTSSLKKNYTDTEILQIGIRDSTPINDDLITLITAILRGAGDHPDIETSLNSMKAEDSDVNKEAQRRIEQLFESDRRPKTASDINNIMGLALKAAAKRAFKQNTAKKGQKLVITRPDLENESRRILDPEKVQPILYLVSKEWYESNSDLRNNLQSQFPDKYKEYNFEDLTPDQQNRLINADIRAMDFAEVISKYPSSLNTTNFIDLSYYRRFNEPYSM